MSKKVFSSLYFKVLLGIALGIAFGFVSPDIAVKLKPLGDAFINLIKMIITPVIFCTVVVGIARMDSLKAVGRVGGKTLLYFEIVTTLALLILDFAIVIDSSFAEFQYLIVNNPSVS